MLVWCDSLAAPCFCFFVDTDFLTSMDLAIIRFALRSDVRVCGVNERGDEERLFLIRDSDGGSGGGGCNFIQSIVSADLSK